MHQVRNFNSSFSSFRNKVKELGILITLVNKNFLSQFTFFCTLLLPYSFSNSTPNQVFQFFQHPKCPLFLFFYLKYQFYLSNLFSVSRIFLRHLCFSLSTFFETFCFFFPNINTFLPLTGRDQLFSTNFLKSGLSFQHSLKSLNKEGAKSVLRHNDT
jgi:hypothetical protein